MKLRADTGIPSPYPISYGYTHPLPIYEWVKYLASTPYPFHRVWIWGTGMGIQRQRESRSVFRISSIDTRPYYYYYYYYLTQYLTDRRAFLRCHGTRPTSGGLSLSSCSSIEGKSIGWEVQRRIMWFHFDVQMLIPNARGTCLVRT